MWFPPIQLPVGFGQTRKPTQLPVLTMVTGYSRWLSGQLIPTRSAADQFAGWWQVIGRLGAVPVVSGAWRRRTDVLVDGTRLTAEVKRMYVAPTARGLGLARRLAHVTYRSEPELAVRFGRTAQGAEDPWNGGRYQVASYLDHHADKLVRRFDAGSYVTLSEAMNSHDIGRTRRGSRLRADVLRTKVMVVSFVHRVVDSLAQVVRELTDSYHPERHYMRGPGPKWRERHGAI